MNSRVLSDTCKSSRNREPFHKSSYNQSRPFPDLYVSSYSHTLSSYQLIIDLWSLYFFPASFSWTGRLSFTSKNCKYFQKQFQSSTSTLKGGTILVCNYQQHFLSQGLFDKKTVSPNVIYFGMSSLLLMVLSICYTLI